MLNRLSDIVDGVIRASLCVFIFGYLPVIMLLGIGWVFAKGFNLFASLFL